MAFCGQRWSRYLNASVAGIWLGRVIVFRPAEIWVPSWCGCVSMLVGWPLSVVAWRGAPQVVQVWLVIIVVCRVIAV